MIASVVHRRAALGAPFGVEIVVVIVHVGGRREFLVIQFAVVIVFNHVSASHVAFVVHAIVSHTDALRPAASTVEET
jgi:hypothetical protein